MRREHIAGLLPSVYQQALSSSAPLRAMLEVMEALHERSSLQLDAVEDLFHPYRCPPQLVPFLARWVAVDHLGSRRDLVARGAALAQSRGTAAGLADAIATATGISEVVVEEPPGRPFHLIIRIPAGSGLTERVRHIVEMEKPAATTYELGELR